MLSWAGPACVPLAVETYGAWGDEAQCTFSRLASLSSLCGICLAQGKVLSDIYGHLNFKLMRATARALLARSPPWHPDSDGQWLNACCVSSIVMYHVFISFIVVRNIHIIINVIILEE